MNQAHKNMVPGKIIVGLSGGVDSAVSALLLKRKGYDVHGLFMKNWEEDDNEEYCAAAEDLKAAQDVAQKLDIPLDTVNFSDEYWDRVFEYFLSELKQGRTPNPDVLCNKEIKFRAFLDYATAQGAEKIATGHYACTRRYPDRIELHRAIDHNKDQTYFLHQVSSEALMNTLFPLCRYEKPAVRKIARDAGLLNHDRKDSTGICFIGKRKFNDFIARYFPNQPGDIINMEGSIIGQHQGLMFHTIGQRKGLGIGGRKGNHQEPPWFVVDKKLHENSLLVAQGHNHPALFSRELKAQLLHWITQRPQETIFNCTARIRYHQIDQPCEVTLTADNCCKVVFNRLVRAITPGQSVVFYQGTICLGGGIIKQSL